MVSFPFYKPFTEIAKILGDTSVSLLKIGGQKEITLDLFQENEAKNPSARKIYELERIHGTSNEKYFTYEVPVEGLLRFCKESKEGLQYIHVHR